MSINRTKIVTTGFAVAMFFMVTVNTFAVEVQISIEQATNVVLSWFTHPGMGENYYVQFRTNLLMGSWETIATVSANENGNITTFTHTNIIKLTGDSGDSGNSGTGVSPTTTMGQSTLNTSASINAQDVNTSTQPAVSSQPLAVRKDGTGTAAPVMIYPPGFSFNGFTIIDPSTGEQMDGVGLTRESVSPVSPMNAGIQALSDPLTPPDDGATNNGDGTITQTAPQAGFYKIEQQGVRIIGLTNNMVLSGTVQFPIEVWLDSTDEVVGIVFYDENKDPIAGAKAVGTNHDWTMTWDTTMAFNGSYNVYAAVCYAGDDSVESIPITVTVSNIISFPYSFTRVFGTQMWIVAQTIPNTTYQLDMYDQNTNWFGSFVDVTDGNGYVNFIWPLKNPQGQVLTDTNFFGVFTVDTSSLPSRGMSLSSVGSKKSGKVQDLQNVSPPVKTLDGSIQVPKVMLRTGSSASASQTWLREPYWMPGNAWAIAYSPLNDDGGITQNIADMLVGGNGGMYGGVVSTLGFFGMGYRLSPGNVSQSSAFQMGDENKKSDLLRYLSGNDTSGDYRYFYFFGHGSGNSFGCLSSPIITDMEVSTALQGNPVFVNAPAVKHPYQLVIMDTCSSAVGGNLCHSFGIPSEPISNQYFQYMGIQPRAYLGFKEDNGFQPNGWMWESLMWGGFFNDWMSGYSLWNCMQRAKTGYHNAGMRLMHPSAVIYGAQDLTIP